MGTFGTTSENVDALEAVSSVPEPGTVSLFALGLALATLVTVRRRSRRSA